MFPKLADDTVKIPSLGEQTCQRIDQTDCPVSQVAWVL